MTPDLGQGGCQAIEDAVTLTCLLRTSGSIPDALARYANCAVVAPNLRAVPGSAFVRASASVQRWAPPVTV